MLCKPNIHKNIVTVIRVGKIPKHMYWFIDMERCDLNLETYILRKWTARLHQRVPFFASIDSSPTSVKVAQAKDLMKDVIEGLVFIHSHRMIHRDLKPRNGVLVPGVAANNSALFSPTMCLEDCRFWSHDGRHIQPSPHYKICQRDLELSRPRTHRRREIHE